MRKNFGALAWVVVPKHYYPVFFLVANSGGKPNTLKCINKLKFKRTVLEARVIVNKVGVLMFGFYAHGHHKTSSALNHDVIGEVT